MNDFNNEAVALKKMNSLMLGDFKQIEYIPGRMSMVSNNNTDFETFDARRSSYRSSSRLSSQGKGYNSNGPLGQIFFTNTSYNLSKEASNSPKRKVINMNLNLTNEIKKRSSVANARGRT